MSNYGLVIFRLTLLSLSHDSLIACDIQPPGACLSFESEKTSQFELINENFSAPSVLLKKALIVAI
ncbi:hypothetical protein, partial [Photobacterium halotolerans]|uniref:hypothetical protein n=1 Tax=Photobacterium halotolerans TaxID=265726 RepID=UPI001F3B7B35